MGNSKMGDGDEKMGISGGGGKFQNPTTTKNPTTSEDADHVLFLAASRPEHVARLISCCSKTSAPAMLSKFSLVVIISTFSPTL